MSLFSRNFYDDDDVSFAPFFRFIDAFDNHQSSKRGGQQSLFRQSFNPKFDVVETKDAYELHGEIPGAERKDISIEFTEPQTIVVHGRVERQRTEGTPPSGLVEGSKDSAGAITEGGEQAPASPSESHRATVTDEETEAAKERGGASGKTQQVAHANASNSQKQAHKPKYWVQERSVGEFHRTFSFPVPVDEGAVKATLNNGVLTVSIPKAEKRSNRRVNID